MDLSIADEDHTSQFYFIDFRFLFSPSSEIPAGNVRAQFEARANEVLASEGLAGCYDFFHDFVLTHKINIFRRQAINLNRTSWAGSLNIEQVHRSLIISYWTNRSAPKNWIEIGVAGNKSTKKLVTYLIPQTQPSLRVKWFRAGKEVQDAAMDIQDSILDCGRLLQEYIERHMDYILSSISQVVPSTFVEDPDRNETMSNTGCALVIPLLQEDELRLRIESSTGRPHISPASSQTLQCEDDLSRALYTDWASVINNFKPSFMLQRFKEQASSAGWHVWSRSASSIALRPRSWTAQDWSIHAVLNKSSQIEWSVSEHETRFRANENSPPRRTHLQFDLSSRPPIQEGMKAVIPGASYPLAIPETTRDWDAIARYAWATIHLVTVQGALESLGVQVQTVVTPKPKEGLTFVFDAAGFLRRPALRGFLDKLQLNIDVSSISITGKNVASPAKYININATSRSNPVSRYDLTDFLAGVKNDIEWDCQVSAYQSVLEACGCRILRSTGTALSFAYNSDPLLMCTINRSKTEPITFGGPTLNPHTRVLDRLRLMLIMATSNADPNMFIKALLKALVFTISAVIEFDRLEAEKHDLVFPHIAAASWHIFEVVYRRIASNTQAGGEVFSTIHMKLRTQRTLSGPSKVVWMITFNAMKHAKAVAAEQNHAALKERLSSLAIIKGVVTTNNHIWLVPLDKVGTVLALMDGIVRDLAAAPPLAVKLESKQEAAIGTMSTQQALYNSSSSRRPPSQPQVQSQMQAFAQTSAQGIAQAQPSRALPPPHNSMVPQPQTNQFQPQPRMQGQHIPGQQTITQSFSHTQAQQTQAQALALAQAQLAANVQVQARNQQNQINMQQMQRQRQQQLQQMQMQMQMQQAQAQGQGQGMRGVPREGFTGHRPIPHQQQPQQVLTKQVVEIVELDD
jgi:hypothetical protein